MSNNALIILGSGRNHHSTKSCIDTVFPNGDYELIDLQDYHIASYDYEGHYPASDQFEELTEKILANPTLILATPVYWYAMSAGMKNFFDRFTDWVTIQKAIGRQLKGKRMFVIASGTDRELPKGFEVPFEKTASYLKMEYKGCIYFSEKGSRLLRITKSHFEFTQ